MRDNGAMGIVARREEEEDGEISEVQHPAEATHVVIYVLPTDMHQSRREVAISHLERIIRHPDLTSAFPAFAQSPLARRNSPHRGTETITQPRESTTTRRIHLKHHQFLPGSDRGRDIILIKLDQRLDVRVTQVIREDLLSSHRLPVDGTVVIRVMLYRHYRQRVRGVKETGIEDVGQLKTLDLAANGRTDEGLRVEYPGDDAVRHRGVFGNVVVDRPVGSAYTVIDVAGDVQHDLPSLERAKSSLTDQAHYLEPILVDYSPRSSAHTEQR